MIRYRHGVGATAIVVLLACGGVLPASRASVEEAIGFALPPGATGFRLYGRNVGLYDTCDRVHFWLPAAEHAQLTAVLPCTLEDCGTSWQCYVDGGHDMQDVLLVPGKHWEQVRIDTEILDNNVPARTGGCRR